MAMTLTGFELGNHVDVGVLYIDQVSIAVYSYISYLGEIFLWQNHVASLYIYIIKMVILCGFRSRGLSA